MGEHQTMRENIIHGLRMKGWSRIDAENEADDRIERRRQKLLHETEQMLKPKSDPA